MTDDFTKLIDGVIAGDPTRHQIDPDERDPVTDETADEAEDTLRKRGLVNPFHAVELQRRQSARKAEQESTLLEKAGWVDDEGEWIGDEGSDE